MPMIVVISFFKEKLDKTLRSSSAKKHLTQHFNRRNFESFTLSRDVAVHFCYCRYHSFPCQCCNSKKLSVRMFQPFDLNEIRIRMRDSASMVLRRNEIFGGSGDDDVVVRNDHARFQKIGTQCLFLQCYSSGYLYQTHWLVVE